MIEIPAELQKKIAESGPVDLVVGVAGPVALSELCAKARAAFQNTPAKIAVVNAGTHEIAPVDLCQGPFQLAGIPIPSANAPSFWGDISTMQRSLLSVAARWSARGCLVIHNDLAALEPETVRRLTQPILEGQVDLVLPIYVQGKYEGLINRCLLAPFSRALYGLRVRFPVAFEFCAGSGVMERLAQTGAPHDSLGPTLLWPSNEIAVAGARAGQATVTTHHSVRTDHIDLSAILNEFAGSMFHEAEMHAAKWQRVRGSESLPRFGSPSFPDNDVSRIDPKPMIESFLLGSRNLEEVWRLVLPPATILDLKRIARLDADQFRMPDPLWARIVYDFALAYRLRRLSRTHVLGALTPLYLGWVASYTQEVAAATCEEGDRRIGLLAKAFEEQKPYFVSRWRWPERVS